MFCYCFQVKTTNTILKLLTEFGKLDFTYLDWNSVTLGKTDLKELIGLAIQSDNEESVKILLNEATRRGFVTLDQDQDLAKEAFKRNISKVKELFIKSEIIKNPKINESILLEVGKRFPAFNEKIDDETTLKPLEVKNVEDDNYLDLQAQVEAHHLKQFCITMRGNVKDCIHTVKK